jgi:hypothetical protein
MERETRFELATLALARRCSTTELLPLVAVLSIPGAGKAVKPRPGRPSPKYPGFSPLSTGLDQLQTPRLPQLPPKPGAFPFPRAQSRRRAW